MVLLNLSLSLGRLLLVLIGSDASIGTIPLDRGAFWPCRRCSLFCLSYCSLQVVRQDCLHLALSRV